MRAHAEGDSDFESGNASNLAEQLPVLAGTLEKIVKNGEFSRIGTPQIADKHDEAGWATPR
jgi:hypothetical protein